MNIEPEDSRRWRLDKIEVGGVEVPPVVDSSVSRPVSALMADLSASLSAARGVRKGRPPTAHFRS